MIVWKQSFKNEKKKLAHQQLWEQVVHRPVRNINLYTVNGLQDLGNAPPSTVHSLDLPTVTATCTRGLLEARLCLCFPKILQQSSHKAEANTTPIWVEVLWEVKEFHKVILLYTLAGRLRFKPRLTPEMHFHLLNLYMIRLTEAGTKTSPVWARRTQYWCLGCSATLVHP